MAHDPDIVLYANQVLDPAPTGVGRYFAELVPALGSTALVGRYVLVASREPGGRGRPSWLPANVPFRRVPMNRKVLHAGWTALGRPTIEDLIRTRPALLHVLDPFVRVPSRSVLVCTIHDLLPLRLPDWYTAKERWMFRTAVRHAVHAAAVIVTDSETVAGEIRSEFDLEEGRVVAVPCGVRPRPRPTEERIDAGCAAHGVRPGSFVISVGEVNGRKDLPTAVRALAAVPGLDLVVVGKPGRGAELLDGAVEATGLQERVRRLGYLPEPEVDALVAGAVALVHPSLYEGFGFTPLEAMGLGTPAVVSDCGSLPEIVGDAALVVPNGDADQWAEALTKVATDTELAAELRRRGRQRVEQFTWERAASAVAQLHASLLG